MTTPYIIFSRKNCTAIRSCILQNYGYIRYEFPFINALAVEVPDEKIPNIRAHKRVAMIARDGSVSKLPLAPGHTESVDIKSIRQIICGPKESADTSENLKAKNQNKKTAFMLSKPKAQSLPFTENQGFGTTIAIIDTGVAPHYDLIKPYNRIIAFKDFVNDRTEPYDDDGHGTHVAGIAAGNGYAVGNRYFLCGTAPMAQIAAIKALDETGSGTTSDILAAMQWIAENKDKYNIKVVNLSLGISADAENPIDPLVIGAAALVARGVTVVTAAGNSGPEPCTVTSPGTSPFVITVGSCDERGRIADFSGRGPTFSGLHKPDLVAPGVDIVSLDAATCKGYIAQSGTSMSSPYAAGIVACLYSENPKITPRQVKSILSKMLMPLPGVPRDIQGRGALFI